ncbi:MAG: SDR family NAD(P)-dependent oxidoreductase [Anaerolineales bacterium]|nr:SDR family NAD(P)-dependent oxidoreductase [Anaerolineales bacterium]
MTTPLAIVVGAARGSGRHAALTLGRRGLHIVVWDVNPDAADRIAAEIVAAGGSAEVVTADITNKMAAQTTLYRLLEAHPQIDVLVNAAEIEPRTPALRMDEGEWDRTLDVGVKGAFLVAQTVARAMQATGGGLIVNVLRPSAVAHAGVSAARAGLAALTGALAAEWAEHNVGVIGLSAAEIETLAVLPLRSR